MATEATRRLGEPTAADAALKRLSNSWGWIKSSARKKPIGAIAASWIMLLIFAAVFAGVLPINNPLHIFGGMANAPALETPEGGKIFLLGGDTIGRDLHIDCCADLSGS